MAVIPLTPTHQAVSVFYNNNMTAHLQDLALQIGASLTRAGYDLTGVTPDTIYQASTIQTRVIPEINGCRITMRFPATGDPDTDHSTGPNPRADVELIGGQHDGEVLPTKVTTLTCPTLTVEPGGNGRGPVKYQRTGYDLHNQRWTYQLCKDTTP